MERGLGRSGGRGVGVGDRGVLLKHMTGQGESLQSSLKIMIIIMVISTAHYPLPNLRHNDETKIITTYNRQKSED